MKLKEVITEIYHRAGLWLINAIAKSGPYRVVRDVPYGDSVRQRMDQYLLPDHELRPTVVFFYGGNWRSGHKEDYRFVADTLLAAGCNVIIPDYRLYPWVRFGEIRDDAVAALKLACDLRPADQPLYLLGHSAGAHLGALVTLDRSLLPEQYRSRLSGFIGLAGPYDYFPFTEDDHWDLFAPEEMYPESRVINFVHADAPPMYLLHGADDTRVRRGHSKSLMEKQLAVGGVARREVYPGLGHVEIILAFSRVHRTRSAVIRHITDFLQSERHSNSAQNESTEHQATQDNKNLKEISHGT
ncbi:MAG: acetyl esterase/lipase [Candidatus Azotimanducaceae bacterium]